MNEIRTGDALFELKQIPDCVVDCCITSPPYFNLRDYGVDGQIGLEDTVEEYIKKLVEIFREVRRTLKSDGTLWLNIGDSYAGSTKGRKENGEHNVENSKSSNYYSKFNDELSYKTYPGYKKKDLIGIPWLLAFALRNDGWYLRQDIIWNKPNAMPESVKDRCTKSHEYIFLFSKQAKYYFDYEAIKEPAVGRKYVTAFDLGYHFGKKVFRSGNSITDECLYEKDNWETIDRLFLTKEAANNCIEKDELLAWLIYTLNRNNNNNKYTLEQLRAVKAILEEEKQCMK